MLIHLPVLAALVLLQDAGVVPQESKGLQILWMPKAVAGTSNTSSGFKFRHPATREDMSFANVKDLLPIVEKLPQQVKENGIWISTTNAFLYTDEENADLKKLVSFAKSKKVYVFLCELPEQPRGWKKLDE